MNISCSFDYLYINNTIRGKKVIPCKIIKYKHSTVKEVINYNDHLTRKTKEKKKAAELGGVGIFNRRQQRVYKRFLARDSIGIKKI